MINQEIAQIFRNIANYLDMEEGQNNFFRIRAFNAAADAVENHPEDIASLNIYDLKKIKGVGDSTAKDILEYVKNGVIPYYEELKAKSPVKLEELIKIQGMGPKRIKKLYQELGVTDLVSLKLHAEAGNIAKLDGFGEKSQASIIENLQFAIVNKERTRIDNALLIAEKYIDYLKSKDTNIVQINYGGSLRRRNETVGDIDLLVSSKDPVATSKVFVEYPEIEKVLGNGDTKSSVWLKQKIQVDLRVINDSNFGAALQYFTGSKDHNVRLRKIAISKGLKLSEYGLFRKSNDTLVASKTEKEIYEVLVNNYVEPELREDGNELDLAIDSRLPKLIDLADIKGDLQMHSTHSDGKNTMEEMVLKCIDLGYANMGFTDHFGNLYVANAVKEDGFNAYFDEILALKEKYKDKIKVLAGAEVNVKPNGDLDFTQAYLEKLDFVVASVHSSLKVDLKVATDRYLNVLDNPVVTIIGHPTGRIIGQRPGFEFNYVSVFQKSAEKGIVMEINAHPARQDLPYHLVKSAVKQGCKIQISTDAHSVNDLELMKYGVFVGRKAGLESKNLFNIQKQLP